MNIIWSSGCCWYLSHILQCMSTLLSYFIHKCHWRHKLGITKKENIYTKNIDIFLKTSYTVKLVYKRHSVEPEYVAFMSSCPLYTGYNYRCISFPAICTSFPTNFFHFRQFYFSFPAIAFPTILLYLFR